MEFKKPISRLNSFWNDFVVRDNKTSCLVVLMAGWCSGVVTRQAVCGSSYQSPKEQSFLNEKRPRAYICFTFFESRNNNKTSASVEIGIIYFVPF